MSAFLLLVAAASLFGPVSFSLASPGLTGRRNVFGLLGSVGATLAFSTEDQAAVAAPPWSGKYDDPNHPGCKREVTVSGVDMTISGTDGEPGPGCTSKDKVSPWKIGGKLIAEDSDELVIDFSPKGGPKDVPAKWVRNGIKFPDGNKWAKIGFKGSY